jgi:hypothetical protein
MRHRPIGIGVQGLADTFILLGMPFDSPEVNFAIWKVWLCNVFFLMNGYATLYFADRLICNIMKFCSRPSN